MKGDKEENWTGGEPSKPGTSQMATFNTHTNTQPHTPQISCYTTW